MEGRRALKPPRRLLPPHNVRLGDKQTSNALHPTRPIVFLVLPNRGQMLINMLGKKRIYGFVISELINAAVESYAKEAQIEARLYTHLSIGPPRVRSCCMLLALRRVRRSCLYSAFFY